MAYIGQKPFQEFSSIPTKDSFTGDGSTTTFDLANDVVRGAENSLEVFIDNVRQEPGSGKAFTLGIDGSSNYRRITFSSAPASGAAIYVINDKTNLTTIAPVQTDFNGVEIVLDADSDTTLHAETDDQVDLRIAGNDVLKFLQSSGDAVLKPMVDAKDIIFQQFDGNKIFEINDGNFVGVGGNATAPGEIRIYEDTDNGSNYSGFKAAASTTSSVAYQLPAADGSSGESLTTNGSGVLSWSAGVTIANDTNNRIVTADGSSGLNGEANLTFDGSTLAVTGGITIPNDGDIGSVGATDAIQISSGGIVTFKDDILIKDSGTIGSASDPDAITIPSNGIVSFSAGFASGNLTFSGQELDLSSGDLTIDVAGDIILDADGADVLLKDAGTTYGTLTNGSGNLIIKSNTTTAATFTNANVAFAGTLSATAITGSGVLSTTDATEATSTTSASLKTAGGLGVVKDIVAGDDIKLLSDSSVIHFGADSEITLTHSADVGLELKHTATADDKPIKLTLQTGETDIAANDVIGQINFQAPDEGTGTDAILVAAGIAAISEGDFSASNNATKLSFQTGASEAASEKMSLSSAGLLTIADDLVIKDGGTIGTASDADAITIAAAGGVTFSQGGTFTVADNSDTLTLKSTDDDAATGPVLNLVRDSSSPADGDSIGRIYFTGDNDAGEPETFIRFKAAIVDASNGSEDGQLRISRMIAGGDQNVLSFLDGETVVNDDSKALNFRVESDGNQNMLLVDGTNNKVFVGTNTDHGGVMNIESTDNNPTLTLCSTDNDAAVGPTLLILRKSDSPADDDLVGKIEFHMMDDNSQQEDIVKLQAQIADASHGTEDGAFNIDVKMNGTLRERVGFGTVATVFNDDSVDVDFRVESDGGTHAFFIEGSSGNNYFGTSSGSVNDVGFKIFGVDDSTNKSGCNVVTAGGNTPMSLHRSNGDGDLMSFRESNTQEGTIAVSGSTVSYNTFTGTHWSRFADNSKPTILRGTVMESLDTMVDWYNIEFNDSDGILQVIPHILQDGQSHGDTITYDHNGTDFTATIKKEDDIKHVQTKISDTSESKSVYGVFHTWDTEEANGGTVNDMMIAAVGTYIVRIKSGQTVAKGDLLQSNGDGTAKVIAENTSITAGVLSTIFAKVLSNTKVETYDDGSFTVPCSFTNA